MISEKTLEQRMKQAKPQLPTDPAFTARVMESIEALPSAHNSSRRLHWRTWAPITALAVLLVVAVPFAVHHHRHNDATQTALGQSSEKSDASSYAGNASKSATTTGAAKYQQLADAAQSDSSAIAQQTDSLSSNDYADSTLSDAAINND